MKKFTAIALILAMLLSLAACANSESPSDSDESSTVNSSENDGVNLSDNSAEEPPERPVSSTVSDPEDNWEPPFNTTTERPFYVEDWVEIEDGFRFPAEFTAEDLDLQAFLKETVPQAYFLNSVFVAPKSDDNHNIPVKIVFPQRKKPVEEQAEILYFENSSIYPKTKAELAEAIRECFSAETAENYISGIGKAELTLNADGTYSAKVIEGGLFDDEGYLTVEPKLMEINGVLWHNDSTKNNTFFGYWDSAKVISQTENEIVFTYIQEYLGFLYYKKGCLVNENGWKYSYLDELL